VMRERLHQSALSTPGAPPIVSVLAGSIGLRVHHVICLRVRTAVVIDVVPLVTVLVGGAAGGAAAALWHSRLCARWQQVAIVLPDFS